MISNQLAELAIEQCGTAAFEQFCQIFASAEGQGEFVPLGGVHDGGADGYLETTASTETFAQISKQASTETKISQTIRRLQDFGRTVKKLVYFTSQIVPNSDTIREDAFDKFGVLVFIRDRKYLSQNVNKYPSAIKAANDLLIPALDYLRDLHRNEVVPRNVLRNHRELSVYLTQEIERRRDDSNLSVSVCDSLILWSLEETDPDKRVFMDEDAILDKIIGALPTAKSMIKSRVKGRLEILSAKGNGVGREINFHKGIGYCLPFSTRKEIEIENAEDAELKQRASDAFADRVMSVDAEVTADQIERVVDCVHASLHHMFELQGLDISCFFAGQESNTNFRATISDSVTASLSTDDPQSAVTHDLALKVLRGVFYDCQDSERDYLGRLSRTYTILFAIQADPKIAEYFDKMSQELVLYVGADILIRAVSEYFLPEKDQSTASLLRILSAAGATLILSEIVLEEMWTHMRSNLLWFESEYQETERYHDLQTATQFPGILMRAYMYAKLNPEISDGRKPRSFANYLSIFVDMDDLRRNLGPDSLQAFIMRKFGMAFESRQDFERHLSAKEVEQLAEKVLAQKAGLRSHRSQEKEKLLARNDASHVLRIYQKRNDIRDNSPDNPFGFRVWWLTNETSVTRATTELVSSKKNDRYLMRPEFLLMYAAYAPKLAEIRKNFKKVFPSTLAVRLAYRARPEIFLETVREAGQFVHTDEARARYTIRKLTNKLKGDVYSAEVVEPVR